MPSYDLETRWGTTPLARAFGGMVHGLIVGGFFAVFCLVAIAIRYGMTSASLETDNLVGWLALYAGGMLLGGAASGALAPIRHRIGRYAQGVVFFGVAILVWIPLFAEIGMSLTEILIGGGLMSAIYAVLLGKVISGTLNPAPRDVQIQEINHFRCGRHRKFR